MITVIDRALLDEVSAAARQAPRRRRNRNFHPADDYPGHRLLNAIEPGSYVMPHRHLDPAKDESIVCLRGRLGIVAFRADGTVDRAVALEPGGAAVGVDIPHGVYHCVLALAAGTVMFEAKAGPYVPLNADEKAPWAPAEGEVGAADYLAGLARLFD